jgi:hypothetical protein
MLTPSSLLAVAIFVMLCLLVFAAPITAAAQEQKPQPPTPSDGDPAGGLDAKEKVTLLAVSLWVFLQVPVALLMRFGANEREANGNVWLVIGAVPLLGYLSWPVYLWMRSRRWPTPIGSAPSRPERAERNRT